MKEITPEQLKEIIEAHEKYFELGNTVGNIADLKGVNLEGVDLRKVNLRSADLEGVSFKKANLQGADLAGVRLQGADLEEANLQNANLWGANLKNANLSKANLQQADLSSTDLYGAILINAILDEAILSDSENFSTEFQCAYFENASINRLRGCSPNTINHLIHLGAKVKKPDDEQERLKLQALLENTQLKLKAMEEKNKRLISTTIPARPEWKGKNFEVDKNLCFVIMPFKKDKYLQEVYTDSTKKAVENLGLTCKRADDIFNDKMIMEDIWEHICRARFIIADLTDKNPNVFYELGLAHTLGKRVVLITQNDEDVPFDLRHLRYIKYEITPRGMADFQEKLSKTIESILKEN